MKYDILLCGVGGQGVLSIAAVIAQGAVMEGLQVKQSEVHGMAQRGGAVQAHLRISSSTIHSDLIPKGAASMILSMEPLESLRYLPYLSKDGVLLSAKEPVLNIPNYPDLESVLTVIQQYPHHRIIPALEIARKIGSPRSSNMVLVGAASKFLPLSPETLKKVIEGLFHQKGDGVVHSNLSAFEAGRRDA
ncbi:MAG: indolepyruvate oxidoreductase subunit beta [Spirochaetes bacterium]|nr:indolepyruvate oxidoreductase subunit beta [Spirochaetota bacterium]